MNNYDSDVEADAYIVLWKYTHTLEMSLNSDSVQAFEHRVLCTLFRLLARWRMIPSTGDKKNARSGSPTQIKCVWNKWENFLENVVSSRKILTCFESETTKQPFIGTDTKHRIPTNNVLMLLYTFVCVSVCVSVWLHWVVTCAHFSSEKKIESTREKRQLFSLRNRLKYET